MPLFSGYLEGKSIKMDLKVLNNGYLVGKSIKMDLKVLNNGLYWRWTTTVTT